MSNHTVARTKKRQEKGCNDFIFIEAKPDLRLTPLF
jgi:hypothetical protein